MILYNMRNRGAFEYDKFVLNALQIHNAITLSELNELTESNKESSSLMHLRDEINKMQRQLIGTETTEGLCDKVHKMKLKLR